MKDQSFCPKCHRMYCEGYWVRRAVRTGICQRLSKGQRAATPIEFRDLLLSMVAQTSAQREAL